MLDFISNCKQTIIKFKKQLLTFALIPVFLFRSSLTSFAADPPFYIDGMYNYSFNGQKGNFKFFNPSGSVVVSGDGYIYTHDKLGIIAETPNTSNISNVSRMKYGIVDGYTYPLIIPNLSDYKFLVMVYRGGITSSSFTFNPSSMSIYTNDASGENEVILDNFESVNFQTGLSGNPSTIGYIYYGDIPSSFDSSIINGFNLYCDSGGVFPIKANVLMYLYNNASGDFEENFNTIVNSINNQTDLIMNAGSGFGGTTSGILSGNDELSGFIDDYTEIEQSMYDKFTENQTAVIGNFSGFSWGSLSTAVDWTSDYLNRIYDNSGDFRTMFMYPILAGIALIFIGRQGLTAYVRSRRDK